MYLICILQSLLIDHSISLRRSQAYQQNNYSLSYQDINYIVYIFSRCYIYVVVQNNLIYEMIKKNMKYKCIQSSVRILNILTFFHILILTIKLSYFQHFVSQSYSYIFISFKFIDKQSNKQLITVQMGWQEIDEPRILFKIQYNLYKYIILFIHYKSQFLLIS
ncbi:hypothetical protein pb186bvf_020532 [Paramecium bursaria]